MFKRMAVGFMKARTASALNSLSDHLLHDMGIDRSEIGRHVDKIYA